jgi:hypothetical protein
MNGRDLVAAEQTTDDDLIARLRAEGSSLSLQAADEIDLLREAISRARFAYWYSSDAVLMNIHLEIAGVEPAGCAGELWHVVDRDTK